MERQEIALARVCLALFLVALLLPARSFSHEGHAHAPGVGEDAIASGPISIAPEAKQNLGLTVAEAEVRTLERVITLIGTIEAIPSHAAAVSSRITGRASALFVNDGERVKKNQPLVEVESLQLGDPPPRVTYRAPFDGTVVDRDVALGDTVDPGKHLIEVADLSEVYAEGVVFEGQVAEVKGGQKARVVVEAFPGRAFEGHLELVSGALESETRTLRVWVRIANPEDMLRPNMRATLHIVTASTGSAIAVPRRAVLGEAGHYFVFVQSDKDELTYLRRNVVIGAKDDRFIEIIEGVFPGDKVVTEGNYQLQYVQAKKPAAEETENAEPGGTVSTDAPIVPWVGGVLIGLTLAVGVQLLLRRRI